MPAPNVSLSRTEVAHLLTDTCIFAQCFKKVTKENGDDAYTINFPTETDDQNTLKRLLNDDEHVTVLTIKGKNEHNMKPDDIPLLTKKVDEVYDAIVQLDAIKKRENNKNEAILILTEGENFHEHAPYTHLIAKLLASDKYNVYLLMCKDPPSDGMVSVNFYNSWDTILKPLRQIDDKSTPLHYFGLTKMQSKSAYTYGMANLVVNLGSSMYQFKPDGVTKTQGYLELEQLRSTPFIWKIVCSDGSGIDEGSYTIFEHV